MKLSSAVPAVVAALGAEVALAVPVIQDDHVGIVNKAARDALMDPQVDSSLMEPKADSEEASSTAVADKAHAAYPPILERKETSELIDHVLKRAGVVEAAAEITPTATAAVPDPDIPGTKTPVSILTPTDEATAEITAAPEVKARGEDHAECDGNIGLYQPNCLSSETLPNLQHPPPSTSKPPPPPPKTSKVTVTKSSPLPTVPPLTLGGPKTTVQPKPDPNLLTPVYGGIGDNAPTNANPDVSDDSYCWQGPEGQVHCVWTNIPKGKPKRTAAPVVGGDLVGRAADAMPMPTTFATEVKRADEKKTQGGPRLPKFTA